MSNENSRSEAKADETHCLQNLILDLFSCSPTKHLNLSDSVCCTRAVTHTTVWLGMVFVPLGTYSLHSRFSCTLD